MAACSISNSQFSPTSQLSQLETRQPSTEQPAPSERARPQLGSAAVELTAPPADSGRGRNVDVVA